jgi:hypothetical protein
MQVMFSNREERAEMLEDMIVRDKPVLATPDFQQVTQILFQFCK